MDKNRIQSIDVFRVFAITAVIAIHTTPFENAGGNVVYRFLSVAIYQGSLFAVPFFFIISGYFWGKKIQSVEIIPVSLAMLKRLALIWLFFSFVYILPYNLFSAFEHGLLGPLKVVYWNLVDISNNPLQFIFEGTKVHLWFIVSLGIAVAIAASFLHFWSSCPFGPMIIFAILLYVFGLCAKAYSETPFGITIAFDTRNGPFFSTLFFVTGYTLSQYEFEPKHLAYGLSIMAVGYIIQFFEVYFLYSVYHVWPTKHDYLLGTFFVGIGAALMALSNHPLLNIPYLSVIGSYTLGIYGIHLLFVEILLGFDQCLTNPFWEVGYVFIVLFLSLGTTLVLSKFKPLKKVFG